MSFLNYSDIVTGFKNSGLMSGDSLMLHSDSIALAQLASGTAEERCNLLFDALDEILGPNGNLVLPTFTYSFTKNEPYNPEASPSRVGLLSNIFLSRPGVYRTSDPIFSMAIKGPLVNDFLGASYEDSFGNESAFSIIEKNNFYIGGFGCGLNSFTFLHYIEQKSRVDYRYFKEFQGNIQTNTGIKFCKIKYYVRELDRETSLNTSLLRASLLSKKVLDIQPIGRVALYMVHSGELVAEATKLINKNKYALIDEGVKCS